MTTTLLNQESDHYKTLVLAELEKNGFVGKMRASIKSQVLKVLETQSKPVKQGLEFDYLTPFHKLVKSKEAILAVHLMRDFLKFYELEYTLPVLENETNIRENIARETVMKEFHLKDNNSTFEQPMLVQILTNYLKDFTKVENMKNSQKNDESQQSFNQFPNFHGVTGDIANNRSTDTENLLHSGSNTSTQGKGKLAPLNFKANTGDGDFAEFKSSNSPNHLRGSAENLKFNTTDLYSNLNHNTGHKDTSPTNEDLFNSTIKKSTNNKPNALIGIANKNKVNEIDEIKEEVIAEDIHVDTGENQDDGDNNMKSGNSNLLASSQTFGYDNSVTSYNLDNYNYTEDVEKP